MIKKLYYIDYKTILYCIQGLILYCYVQLNCKKNYLFCKKIFQLYVYKTWNYIYLRKKCNRCASRLTQYELQRLVLTGHAHDRYVSTWHKHMYQTEETRPGTRQGRDRICGHQRIWAGAVRSKNKQGRNSSYEKRNNIPH